ncbi:MAG: alginate export family protein [Pseudomonadales bacterium]|nr:alginate export family protein [Pseudomonadales bacterium]
MKNLFPCTLSAPSLALIAVTLSTQVQADDFYEAVSGGKATLDARMRYESADVDNPKDTAMALTLRTRLGYKTAELAKTTAFVEMDDVRVVAGMGDYNPYPADKNHQYNVIADPEMTELNQAYLSFKPVEGLEVIAGRQRLIIDNARFIGNVGWRQHEQTFDALTAKYKLGRLDLIATYSGRQNTVLGDHQKTKDIFTHLAYSFDGIGKVSGFYYGLDNDAGDTLDTLGIRFVGQAKLGESSQLLYSAEFATQSNETTASKNDADYMLLELGYGMDNWSLSAGYELLGSDHGEYGFTSKYGTNHAFNGWADKFLSTPDDGLEDLYIKAVVKAVGMKFVVMAHDFSANDSGKDLGSEIDFLAVKPFAKKYNVGFKYAGYSEGDVAMADTTKFWLWGEMKF